MTLTIMLREFDGTGAAHKAPQLDDSVDAHAGAGRAGNAGSFRAAS